MIATGGPRLRITKIKAVKAKSPIIKRANREKQKNKIFEKSYSLSRESFAKVSFVSEIARIAQISANVTSLTTEYFFNSRQFV